MNDRVDLQRLITAEPLPGATPAPCVAQGVATVVEVNERSVLVQCGDDTVAMRVAASCLLLPAAGDRVWWCAEPGDAAATCWVTHLLERVDTAEATLQLPSDATLRTSGGFLRIASTDLRFESDALQIKARHASVLFDTAETIGACWQGIVTALRWTGSSISAVVGSVTLVAKTHQRYTEGSDTVRAGTLDLRAQGLATVHAQHVLIEGERLVKSRAPQIHMG